MKQLIEPAKQGLIKSTKMLWLLTKIVIPVSCLVTILNHYSLMDRVASFFAPVMSLAGLPGEGAVVLTMAMLVNFYAAIGVLTGLTLDASQVTVLALMIGICHELPVETMICSKAGLRIPYAAALRISVSLLAGMALYSILSILPGG